MRFILAVCFGVFVSFGFSQNVWAQNVTKQFGKPMPKLELTPVAEFREQADLVKKTIPNAEAMNFQIHIPKGWTESGKGGFGNIEVSSNVLGELMKYYGPPALPERSRIVVEASGLEYNMTAEQWMMQYLLANGYNIQGVNIVNSQHAESIYVLIENTISYAVRAVAYVNGKNVLFAQYFVPMDRYHDEKVTQAHVINSFGLLTKVTDFVEEMEEYQFLDLAAFKYPTSWDLRALPVRSIDRMKVELVNVAELSDDYGKVKYRLDGQVDVELVSIYASETLEDEIERFRAAMTEKGLTLGEVIEIRDDFLLGDKFDFVDTQVYRVTPNESRLVEHEFWLSIMSSGEYYYFVSLFTPSRDHDYFKWARNAETYKLVTSLIEPNKDAFIP